MEIKIKINGIELTEEEAKELYFKLSDLFSRERKFIYVPYVPQISPSVPQPWEITYGPTCSNSDHNLSNQ